jgi:multidrug resistance efflux pump
MDRRPDRVKLRQQQAQIAMLQVRVARLEAQLAAQETRRGDRNGADIENEAVEVD